MIKLRYNFGSDTVLLLLYITVCAAILLRVSVEGTGYTSPDSEYYMEAAQRLKMGEGFYIKDLYNLHRQSSTNGKVYFTAWPIGYPALIYTVSIITTLNVFWASKVVNLIFVGFGFLLMRHINKEHAYLLASIYGAFTIIENYSYTWSEGPFMFGALCFAYLASNIYSNHNRNKSIILLLITAIFLFLIRYIGIYTVGAVALAAIYYWWNKDYNLSKKHFQVLAALCLFISLYLFRNYYIAGYATGIPRIYKNMESIPEVAVMAMKGLAGEFFIIRRYYFRGVPDWLFFMTLLFQIVVLWLAIKNVNADKSVIDSFRKNHLSLFCFITAFLYLILLVFLRSISQFDPINARLLSPFTFLMLFGFVNYIAAVPAHCKKFGNIKTLIFIFFLTSLLLNLPKEFLLQKAQQLVGG
ncbi:hypothetical protein [Pontibacter harenae]|uniref:hypothetical protein n=1 Tax=Pontibacter harenae TaxID=2894083 RepID=UPI001E5F7AD5|nr:hypothetical protein [Pontibacter harenae]MCC9167333.1 hypothetical protein [Pontibacter harenae]